MDYLDGKRMIEKARDRQTESKMFLLYANMYPNMTKKTFVKFEDFYKKTKTKVSTKPVAQILAEVEEIRKRLVKGK